MILGSGPNRIGQGIEFDYCCVHAALACKEAGLDAIMINCNPETVSTDYDISSKLFLEPVTVESVSNIYRKFPNAKGVIVQYGGQTPLKIAEALEERGLKILGTSVDSIQATEDRKLFEKKIVALADQGIKQPKSASAKNIHPIK
jgi:carbamoyl-phosphate synthase large subunit